MSKTVRRSASRERARPGKLLQASLLTCVILIFIIMGVASIDLLARGFLNRIPTVTLTVPEAPPEPEEIPVVESHLFSLRDLYDHPDRIYEAYTAAPLTQLDTLAISVDMVESFRNLLNIYVQRQAVDDNFTIRVVDGRTFRTLERFTLSSAFQEYQQTGTFDWRQVDRLRAQETRRLVEKWQGTGIPNNDIMVKWGRQNQVRDAREREAPYTEYEIRLARYMGLSQLVTELGTVETFNSDRMVSSVGARSRYQLMPYMLRKNGIEQYTLYTPQGRPVEVKEEWHPLLTMETAFSIARAYTNAVGHEIPGISAYHTGPYNIYKAYQLFLVDGQDRFTPTTTVIDAYLWALTDGFDRLSNVSSFRQYSRNYIPSVYGSLRATEDMAIDTTRTLLVEQLHVKDNVVLTLSTLLDSLATDSGVVWDDDPSVDAYEGFRRLNPHFELPDAEADAPGVPARGNVRLVAERQGHSVRFFLPLGASERLIRWGLVDSSAVTRFDHDTYLSPPPDEITEWDRQYEDLVRDIQFFGFTVENKQRLEFLAERFERLAEEQPGRYRSIQLRVIDLHREVWQSKFWTELAQVTEASLGQMRIPSRPPEPLQLARRPGQQEQRATQQ